VLVGRATVVPIRKLSDAEYLEQFESRDYVLAIKGVKALVIQVQLSQGVEMITLIDGRWDAVVRLRDRDYASWFEINSDGGLSGRYVGIEGSARPMAEVRFEGNELYFSLPPSTRSGKVT